MSSKNSPFHFRTFSIDHCGCAQKIGTDAVLLGCWATSESDAKAIDLCAGCGVIGLLVQHRFSLDRMDFIEVSSDCAALCQKNASHSPPPKNAGEVFAQRIQDVFPKERYQTIVCNPPYFHGTLNANEDKRTARHLSSLSWNDLWEWCARFSTPDAVVHLVLPDSTDCRETAALFGFTPVRWDRVVTKEGGNKTRELLAFQRVESSKKEPTEWFLFDSNGKPSARYEALVGPFMTHLPFQT